MPLTGHEKTAELGESQAVGESVLQIKRDRLPKFFRSNADLACKAPQAGFGRREGVAIELNVLLPVGSSFGPEQQLRGGHQVLARQGWMVRLKPVVCFFMVLLACKFAQENAEHGEIKRRGDQRRGQRRRKTPLDKAEQGRGQNNRISMPDGNSQPFSPMGTASERSFMVMKPE